ncbi:MAG: hypothetical protein IJP44_14600, partial [Bacteroidales bacterium]|nr:hypothetical protein [Bacteroidales bacterium]
MCKRHVLLLLLFALFAPWAAQAQEELTVYDGTVTNNVVPAYIFYFDDFTRSQFVIPAGDLAEMDGGTLSSMKFYTTSSNVPYTTVSTVDVYLMEVDYTTITALEPKANGTIVYQGTLDVVSANGGGELTIEFASGYTYNGGNLLVGIENTTDAGYKNISFYGQTVTGASWAGYNSSSLDGVTGSQRNFIPKTTFTYEPASTGCDGLETLTLNGDPEAHNATLAWTGGSGTYNIEYKKTTDSEWTLRMANYAGYGIMLVELDAGTAYQARVQSVCDGDLLSNWKTVSFTTPVVCPAPTGLNVALTPGDGTKATFSWTENGTATQWQLCLNGDETNLIEMTENPFTYTSLTPETAYTAKVRAYCDATDQSAWSNEVTFTPTNAYSITVNDGTSTNGYIPVYGYYVDGSIVSQFIMPAEGLAAMQWGTISKLTFYAAADKNWGAAQFEVYMTETSETTLSALADWSSLTKVMNAASLSISGNQMVVTLDAPYQYMGGNLMIGINQTVSGTYSSCSWYGVTATGASLGGYGTSISQQNFLPKTTFEFTPGEEPDCYMPTGLAVSYTGGTEASISWTSEATAWNIDVNGTVTAITENPYTLTGLELATTYEVKVQADCGDSQSDWTNA